MIPQTCTVVVEHAARVSGTRYEQSALRFGTSEWTLHHPQRSKRSDHKHKYVARYIPHQVVQHASQLNTGLISEKSVSCGTNQLSDKYELEEHVRSVGSWDKLSF